METTKTLLPTAAQSTSSIIYYICLSCDLYFSYLQTGKNTYEQHMT